MSDSTDKKGPNAPASGFPGGADDNDLVAEFDAWDKNLDSLFEEESTADSFSVQEVGPISATHALPNRTFEADEFETSLDFLNDSGELDSLFNDTPLPLPPIEDSSARADSDQDAIISSAARPDLPDRSSQPMSQPADATLMAPTTRPTSDLRVAPDDDAAFGQVTRVVDTDDALFAANMLDSSSPALRPPTLPPSAKNTVRRTPSIVRRTELERMRAQRADDSDYSDGDDGDFGAETTRIADAHQLESLMESAAAQSFSTDLPDEPEISLVLDDEFYDDIEIGESSGESELKQPTNVQRRVSQHVVRRTPTAKATPPHTREQSSPVSGTAPDHGDDEVTGESASAGMLVPEMVAGRDVDPEMTLDFRVVDTDLPPDEDNQYGEDLDDPFDAPTTARTSSQPLGPAASFDDVVATMDLETESEVEESTNVAWSPTDQEQREHAFLDLAPSPRDTGSNPPQRPSRINTRRSLAFLEGATDFNELPTVDPVPEVKPSSRTDHEITSVRDSAPLDPTSAVSARAATPAVPDDIVSPEPASEPEARAPAAPAELAKAAQVPRTGDMPAPNSTYDFGLPAVVPKTQSTPAAELSLGEQATPAVSEPAVIQAEIPPAATPARPSAFADAVVAGESDWPALPPPVLPQQLPGMDSAALAAIDVPERLSPEDAAQPTPADILAAELGLYERELESDEFGRRAKEFRLEAGRLCEQSGDLDRARLHFEEALGHDPLLGPALRGLRRIERASGDWNAAMNYLDAELEDAGPIERRALLAHKADVLMAVGEQDLARVVVGERLDEEPDNVRALLANLELAFVDDRDDEFDATLDRLATALASPELVSCMHLLRGRLSERPVGQPSGDLAAAMAAYAKAADAGSTDALVSMAMAAQQLGDLETATAAIGRLAGTELEARDPDYVAALEWRRARWARLAGDHDGERNALIRATALGQSEPLILADLAALETARGDSEAAAHILTRLVEHATSPAERASAEVRLADCLSALGRGAEAADALRRAAQDDPGNPVATGALEQVLEASGDIDGLIELGRRAAESDPAGAVFERVRAAGRLVQAGQYQSAIEDLQAGRAAVPDSPALSDALLDAFSAAGAFEERLALLQQLTNESGEMRDAEALLLQLANSSDAYVAALGAQLEQARADLGAASEQPDGTLLEAERDLADKRDRAVTQALDAWNRVLERDPESADAYAAMTRLCAVLDQPDLLDDALARAQSVAHDVDYAVTLALARAALVLAEAEPDLPRAEDIAREAMELAPSDPRPPLVLLDLAMRQGRLLDAAMMLEERAASISDPEHAASLRYRSAVLLLGRADEPAQAIELLRSVVETRPDFDAARELLEVAHKRLGEPMTIDPAHDQGPTAGASLERVIRQAEARLYQLGDPARALELLREAMRERPDDALLRHGLQAAARAAADPEILTELAHADLARAESKGDSAAKADAYEALARIDSELRGDPGSARTALESAVALDGARVRVLRALERLYAKEHLFAELFETRGKQLQNLESEGDRVAWHMDRARLASLIDRPIADVLVEYRAIYERDRHSRPALFYLETEARTHGPSDMLAALEADIAQYFQSDERAHAAFLTRSAETLVELGQTDIAIERFRAASVQANGFLPALAGWRQAAIAGQRFAEVAEAALREAELCTIDSERASLFHLAGVAAMDRAEAPETAINAFEQVLALDPAHDDAFARLYKLYLASGQHERIAHILEQRLEVEEEPEALARVHRALADLMRTELADPDRARQHLRAILEIRPNEPGAIEALSEIAWAEEAWDDAADTLIVRARMETDPALQKEIFFRLGVIYVEHKPEPEWALESFKRVLAIDGNDQRTLEYIARLGNETKDFQLALRACERLVELEQDAEAKVGYLHRMGQIFSEGVNDRVRAERVYRSALELAPQSARALSALVEFFERGGDLRSMRVHLDRVLGTMRAELVESPQDGSVYRVLARALAARERAGVPGSLAAARCAAELASIVAPEPQPEGQPADQPDDQEISELARAAGTRPPVAGLCNADLDDLLFPPVVANAVRQIFNLIGDRVAKHVGIDLRRYGVGRADRLKGNEHPIERVAEAMAAEIGIDTPALYVSSKETRLLVVEPTQPMSVVVSADVLEGADAAHFAFALGRSMKLAQSGFAVPARMSLDEFGVLMVSLLRLFEADFAALGIDGEAVATQQQRLRRLIPNSLIQELRPFAISMAGPDFDYRALYRGIQEAGNRAGLLACGSARAALTTLATLHGADSAAAALTDPEINPLVRFAVSDDHAKLCGQLAGSTSTATSG